MSARPILLRPTAALADAMTAAAAAAGSPSRQTWMLDVLTAAAADHMPPAVDPDDLPLFDLTGDTTP